MIGYLIRTVTMNDGDYDRYMDNLGLNYDGEEYDEDDYNIFADRGPDYYTQTPDYQDVIIDMLLQKEFSAPF